MIIYSDMFVNLINKTKVSLLQRNLIHKILLSREELVNLFGKLLTFFIT